MQFLMSVTSHKIAYSNIGLFDDVWLQSILKEN